MLRVYAGVVAQAVGLERSSRTERQLPCAWGLAVIDDYVVHLIKEYLDRSLAKNEPVRLATMLHQIDYRNRTIPRFEEVNRALKLCPGMYVHGTGGAIEFAPVKGGRKISADDMQQAYVSYREWFDRECQKLQSGE